MRRFAVVAAVLTLCSAAGFADTLVLKDGRTLTGRIISQDGGEVVFDIQVGASAARVTYKADQIAEIKKGDPPAKTDTSAKAQAATSASGPASGATSLPASAPAGATYYVIPIEGEIGKYVTAELVGKSLKQASQMKAAVVVLEVNSDGGEAQECQEIVTLLGEYKGARLVAFVKKAGSAAAIITLTCREIYMQDGAIIGSAMAIEQTPWGVTRQVNEKYQAYWRAACRAAAEKGGHQPLLAEAMINTDMELHVEQKDGKPVVAEGPGSVMLKRRGKILAMTARESVDCGLAAKVLADEGSLPGALGFDKWTKLAGGQEMFAGYKKEMESAVKELDAMGVRFKAATAKLDSAKTPKEALEACGTAIAILQSVRKHGQAHPGLRLNDESIASSISELQALAARIKAKQ